MKRTDISTFVLPGESLGAALSDGEAYAVYPVYTPTSDDSSNTVLFDVRRATEPVHVTADISMKVQAIKGEGDVVVLRPDGQEEIRQLTPDLGAVALGAGVTYWYARTDYDEPFVVRDICRPAFCEGDEVSMETLSSPTDAHEGDYLLIWNPRHVGGVATAGALRVALLALHDTTAENAARASSPKYVGVPSHYHAAVQRAGEQDIWPVNVLLRDEGVHIAPHRQAADTLNGPPPSFPVQDDYRLFRAL